MESCKPAIRQNKNEKQVNQANSSAVSSPKNDALTPFPSDVSMLWNLCRDPTPLGFPCLQNQEQGMNDVMNKSLWF